MAEEQEDEIALPQEFVEGEPVTLAITSDSDVVEAPKPKGTTNLRRFLKPYEPWLKFPNHSHVRGAMYQKYKFDVVTQFDTSPQMLKALYTHVKEAFPSDLEISEHSPYSTAGLTRAPTRRELRRQGFSLPVRVSGVVRNVPVTDMQYCSAHENVNIPLQSIYDIILRHQEGEDTDYDVEETVSEAMRDWSYDLEEYDSSIDYDNSDDSEECWDNAEYEFNMTTAREDEARQDISNWLRDNYPNSTITPQYILNSILDSQ
jgi:hypothetical protein